MRIARTAPLPRRRPASPHPMHKLSDELANRYGGTAASNKENRHPSTPQAPHQQHQQQHHHQYQQQQQQQQQQAAALAMAAALQAAGQSQARGCGRPPPA